MITVIFPGLELRRAGETLSKLDSICGKKVIHSVSFTTDAEHVQHPVFRFNKSARGLCLVMSNE